VKQYYIGFHCYNDTYVDRSQKVAKNESNFHLIEEFEAGKTLFVVQKTTNLEKNKTFLMIGTLNC
jgi:hypothetical protein